MNDKNPNKEIAKIFYEMAELLEIRGRSRGVKKEEAIYKPIAYRKAANFLMNLDKDISEIYEKEGIKGLIALPTIGNRLSRKIEGYLKKNQIKDFEDLKKETAIQQIVAYYFQTKGLSLQWLKENARKKKIIYSRFAKPAEQLLILAGSLEKAKEATDKIAQWAKSRGLDYSIETVFKKWLELDRLKPKEVVKKPFYRGNPMIWSETRKKWFVISPEGEWLEFADKEKEIEWKIIK